MGCGLPIVGDKKLLNGEDEDDGSLNDSSEQAGGHKKTKKDAAPDDTNTDAQDHEFALKEDGEDAIGTDQREKWFPGDTDAADQYITSLETTHQKAGELPTDHHTTALEAS